MVFFHLSWVEGLFAPFMLSVVIFMWPISFWAGSAGGGGGGLWVVGVVGAGAGAVRGGGPHANSVCQTRQLEVVECPRLFGGGGGVWGAVLVVGWITHCGGGPAVHCPHRPVMVPFRDSRLKATSRHPGRGATSPFQ